MMNNITINKSMRSPIASGVLRVDTSRQGISICLPRPSNDDVLIITKISQDHHPIVLYSKTLIDGSEVIIFGLSKYAQIKKGQAKSITIQGKDGCWKIIAKS